jgi:hypothetical protein
MMKIFAALFGSAFVLAVGAGSAATGNGLYGKVTRGPITPMCVAEQPCTEPAAGAVLMFSRGGSEVGRTRVRADGTYRVALPAAVYSVNAASRRPLDPASARVVAGRFRHVDFSIDTGIR